MGFIAWIVLGGLAGWVASLLTRGRGHGFVLNVVIGIIGALIGGFVVNLLGGSGVTGFNLWSFVVAVVGAVILLWLVNLFSGKKEA